MHGHQGPTKQHPKTPMRFGQRDENAPATVVGKVAIGGARVGGNENVMMTKGRGGKQAVVTPIGKRLRLLTSNHRWLTQSFQARAPGLLWATRRPTQRREPVKRVVFKGQRRHN